MASLNTLNYSNVGAYAVNTFITFYSMTGAFGLTNAEVSAKYQTLITPAGWAFSIWGVIFTGELAFVLAQLSPSIRASDLVQKGVSWGWVWASAFQCAWTFAFAQEQLVVSSVLMFGILFSLAVVVYRCAGLPPTPKFDLICRIPLTLHFGWVACAAALNVNLCFVQSDAAPASQLAAGLTSLCLLLVLGTQIASHKFTGRTVVAGVAAWALLAIADELKNPMDLAQCKTATGGEDCNMISSMFEPATVTGVARTSIALSTLALGAVALVMLLSLPVGGNSKDQSGEASEAGVQVTSAASPLM
jgi:hypothetical protein